MIWGDLDAVGDADFCSPRGRDESLENREHVTGLFAHKERLDAAPEGGVDGRIEATPVAIDPREGEDVSGEGCDNSDYGEDDDLHALV